MGFLVQISVVMHALKKGRWDFEQLQRRLIFSFLFNYFLFFIFSDCDQGTVMSSSYAPYLLPDQMLRR